MSATPDPKPVGAGRLIDLANFALAFRAYGNWLVEAGQDGSKDALYGAGFKLGRRYMVELVNGTSQHIAPLMDDSKAAAVAPAIRKSQRAGNPVVTMGRHADMFQTVLPWMLTKQAIFRGMFQGKVAKAARMVANAAQEESFPALLNKSANIMPVSGLRIPSQWITKAAKAAGAELTSTELTMVDAKLAKALGEDLKSAETDLAVAQPNTPEAAALEERRTEILARIEQMAEESDSPDTVRAVAGSVQQMSDHATETGRRLGHTIDQEAAMIAQGRAIIAAGAGSGKTRVLASKVAYHINELGVDPTAILATTFTTKAAGELKKRVADYGAVIEGVADDNFGTTHSIAGKMLNRRATAFRRPKYIGKKEMWKQSLLIRLAMEQVQMTGGGEHLAPQPKGFWEDAFVPDTPPGQDTDMADYQAAVDDAIGFYRWASENWQKPWRNRPGNQKAADWAGRVAADLMAIRSTPPSQLTPRQKDWLNKSVFPKVKRVQYRVAAKKKEDEAPPEPKQQKKKLDDYTYYKRPAGQWFNLGRKLTREIGEGAEMGIPLGEFKNAISILKGKGISPSEAWTGQDGPYGEASDAAAVYAAYEWLKGSNGEPEFQSTGDMDDILIDTVKALVGSPTLRRQMEAQYKVLLIDEAQDLNRVQHLLFGLMAGYLDAETLEPHADKHMSADTYCLIGDDKQAIYEFRGADPGEFIDKSNLTEGGDNFSTKILDLNFRSGEAIVQGANRLIAHNCIEEATPINTPQGDRKASDLQIGDSILTYRNGEVVTGQVSEIHESLWTEGFCIRTHKGHEIVMSPNHRLWASEPLIPDNMVSVYLMYREDFGYRIGTTSCGGRVSQGSNYPQSLGARAAMEHGERMWIIGVYPTVDEALHQESILSLRYSIPMTVFRNRGRTPSDDRIVRIFQEFGSNGLRLLEERHLSPEYPHWAARSQRGHGRNREVISFIAHGARGSQVYLRGVDGDIHTRKQFAVYEEAQQFVWGLSRGTGHTIIEKMQIEDAELHLMTASALMEGMMIPVLDEGMVTLQRIQSIQRTKGTFLDLGIEGTCNFFGGGILSHNSKQVPMVCKANVDRNGTGQLISRPAEDSAEAGVLVAEEIESMMETAEDDASKYIDFGVAVRSNAEAYHYGLEMLKRGIPFKSNARFFSDPNTKALIGWLTIAENGIDGPPAMMEQAVKDAMKAPYSRLGKALLNTLMEDAGGTPWTKYLVDNASTIYRRDPWKGFLEHFAENIKAASKLTGTPPDILGKIMLFNGVDGTSMQTGMIRSVAENEDIMAELAAASEGGVVTQEQLDEAALAPVEPLIGLMSGKEELGPAMTFVRKLRAVNDKVTSKDTEEELDRDAVTIGTMHSWKGLECPNVYAPMVGGKFPRTGPDGTALESPDLWSERRLAYVAITRAEQRCCVLDIPNPKTGHRSQFLAEACVQPEGMPADGEGKVPKTAAWQPARDEIEELMDLGYAIEQKLTGGQ